MKIHLNTPVNEILLDSNQVSGVRIDTQKIAADVVVSNMDVYFTYHKLLKTVKAPNKVLNQPKSTSALIFYWGINGQFPELDLHNVFFSDDYKNEFKQLEMGQVHRDPTVYVYISSKHNPEDAPDGKENWFVMINVPYNSGQDWDKIIQEAKANIIKKLSQMLDRDMEPLIEEQGILEPRLIEQQTSSHLGALYGSSSNNMFAAFLRHPNFSRKIDNLYFCGGSVHPGGGIPLCMASAKIIDKLIG